MSSTFRLATTPPANLASIALASDRQPDDTHFYSIGTESIDPEGDGMGTGAKSISFPLPVRK